MKIILRGKVYDFTKASGKWVLPIIVAVLGATELFIESGNFSGTSIALFVISILTIIANMLQTVSKSNYEEESHEELPN